MSNSNKTFNDFLGPILTLHPKWEQFTIDADVESKLKFSNLTDEQKFSLFPADFQSEVKSIYENHISLESLSHKIAVSVYNLLKITGKPHADLKLKLESAFGKEYSKSYFSKLLQAGEVLSNNPEFSGIKDIEKLYIMSKVDPETRTQIANENKLASMSRNDTQKTVDKYQKPNLSVVSDEDNAQAIVEYHCKMLRSEIIAKLKDLDEKGLVEIRTKVYIICQAIADNKSSAA